MGTPRFSRRRPPLPAKEPGQKNGRNTEHTGSLEEPGVPGSPISSSALYEVTLGSHQLYIFSRGLSEFEKNRDLEDIRVVPRSTVHNRWFYQAAQSTVHEL
jgi:hypothetical protein